MSEIKVSVIVPIYNVENYLKDCLDSLVNQTYSNFEVILVNDGSSDHSLDIAMDYANQYDFMQVVTKQNGGLSDARNYGMKYAKGDYVCFVDSDDWVSEYYIELMVNKAKETGVACVLCDMMYVYDDQTQSFSSGGDILDGDLTTSCNLVTLNNSACNKLMAKSIVDAFEFPVGMAYEDLATIPVSLALAKKIAKVDQPLYFYRQRLGSIAHSANKKVFDIYKAIDRCIQYFKQHAMEQYIPYMQSLYVVHGLELTTLRIKDFDDTQLINEYFKENMELLKKYYPNYKQDSVFQSYGLKKKIIFKLLELGQYNWVKKIYGKN